MGFLRFFFTGFALGICMLNISASATDPDFPLLHSSCSSSLPEEENCAHNSSPNCKPLKKTAQLWGWRIEDATTGPNTNESWAMPDTSSDVEECLLRCHSLHANCYVVSYDADTGNCLGFSRQARLRFSRNFVSSILARTQKKMCPLTNGLQLYHAGEDLTPTPDHVGTIEICLTICVITPRCNYAVYSLDNQRCFMSSRTELKDADIRAGSKGGAPWKYSALVAM